MTLSKDTIKALKGLRRTHWAQISNALDRMDDEGSYYGNVNEWNKRREDIETILVMVFRDFEPKQ